MKGKGGAKMEERIVIDPEIQHGKPVIRGSGQVKWGRD
jgi:uncharacterized protein (DUF433 family)